MEYGETNLLFGRRNFVVLKSSSSVPVASRLTGEALFDRKVEIAPFALYKREYSAMDIPAFRWGWYSNASSSVDDIKLRFPRMAPLRGTFEPFREGRHVIFKDLPANLHTVKYDFFSWLYTKLHRCDVLSTSSLQRYADRDRDVSFADVEFATKEEAEAICQSYNGKISFQGLPVRVEVRRPPMKHLAASWDPGHNRAHGQPRDYGTAKNTNFEAVRRPHSTLATYRGGQRQQTDIAPDAR